METATSGKEFQSLKHNGSANRIIQSYCIIVFYTIQSLETLTFLMFSQDYICVLLDLIDQHAIKTTVVKYYLLLKSSLSM